MQEMGHPMSMDAFRRTVLSGCQFVALMMDALVVKKCSKPPGAPSIIDTALKGFTDLSFMSDTFAADW
jgi:hypothetical protein